MTKNDGKPGLSTFLKGMAMGAADIVPGVSGGTIAFITGIYERLIRAVSSIDHRLWKVLREQGIRAVWREMDGGFLLILLAGIGVSILSLAQLIGLVLEAEPVLVWSFFFGLILASIPFVGRRVYRWKPGPVLSFIAGVGVAFWITTLPPLGSPDQNIFFFLAGALAICAMVLPGISGSFILLLLGAYRAVIDAVKGFDLEVLAIFSLGCLSGLLLFTKLLNWMFQRYHDLTIALMSGFLLGSLNKVWPWKGEGSGVDGKELPGGNIAPWTYGEVAGQDAQLFWAVLLCVAGMGAIALLERTSLKRT